MPIVEAKNLRVAYNDFLAVKDISFEIEVGQVIGFLGSNGAGKSSTLKVLGGVLTPTQGTVVIDGYKMSDYTQADAARGVLGYCPDVGGLIPQATLREHIGLSLTLHQRLELWEQALHFVELFGLEKMLDTVVAGFSHGMSRRASVILAAVASKSLLILDEPFDGVDPLGVAAVNEVIRTAADAGVAVVVSTHLQDTLAEATDRILVMSGGSILANMPSADLRGKEGIQAYKYLLEESEPV